MPFDLAVADIDSDGMDEALVASGDGALYAVDHDGRPALDLHAYRPPVPGRRRRSSPMVRP